MIKNSLSSHWKLPTYAQPYIQINTPDAQQVSVTTGTGIFKLEKKPNHVTVSWGTAPLTQLTWQDQSLHWDGTVRLGGFVTAIHFAHMEHLDMDLAMMTVEAYPLMPDIKPYLTTQDRAQLPYQPSDFLDGVDDTQSEGVTTWLADIDSPLVGLMQDAMNQGHRVYVFGQLASEENGWHNVFALPILLEAVTTFIR